MTADFEQLRNRRQAELSDADKAEYDKAYSESSFAAELVYSLRSFLFERWFQSNPSDGLD